MAVTISASWQAFLTVLETLDATSVPGAPAATRKVSHSAFNGAGLMDAATVIPATKCAVFTATLSSGALTVDLTSLTHNGQSVTFSGLKVQAILLENTSAAAIRIKNGASNGYLPGNGSAWDVTIPGASGTEYGYLLQRFNDSSPDVDSTHKTFDLTGTAAQTLNIALVAG